MNHQDQEITKRVSQIAYQSGDSLQLLCNFIPTNKESLVYKYITFKETEPNVLSPFIKEENLILTERIIELTIKRSEDLKMTEQLIQVLGNEYKQEVTKNFISHLFNKEINTLYSIKKVKPNFFIKFFKKLFKIKDKPEEHYQTLRRVIAKIIAASNLIATNSRRGPANTIICGGCMAAVLQDSAAFCVQPTNNLVQSSIGNLYPVGSIAGLSIFVDPYMKYSDKRVLVGRFSTEQDQLGVKFAYDSNKMKMSVVADGTKAPVVQLSAYDILFFPENFESLYEICDFEVDLI